ncbi:HTTM domain-containing protein [Sorangium sp. So ce131]|uniref:HTTM domain-containing protein n=1 Tax=Sorangium sp. So ce131 TaxID=3133282 RepID=UPI003F61F53C
MMTTTDTSTSTCTANTRASTSTGTSTGIDVARRFAAHLTAEVDAASLAVFRVGYGALIAWEVVRYALHDRITRYYIEPTFFFSYVPFVRPWGGDGMYWHFGAIFVLSLLVAAGLFYRASAALLCAALTYVFLLDKAQYLNHLYLVCLLGLLLAATPAHRALSVDHLLARRAARSTSAAAPPETAPRLHLFALKAQVAIVYFYGGVAKLNGDWLRGQPLTMWLAEHADAPLVGPLLASPAAGLALSYAGLAIDLSMGFLLFSRRTFPIGAAIALTFNLSNAFLFKIGIFPYVMIASLALFADPSWPRRRLPFLFRGAARPNDGTSAPAPGSAPAPERRRALPLALLCGYLLVQLLLPLRHWLYPGDVAWNEAGHRFSWRMKLRDKSVSELSYTVVDPRTGVREPLDLEEWLTDRQLGEMGTRPDMLVDFAHHVADRWQEASGVRPIVTAKVVASLNGGPERDLLDPTLDLASQPRGLLAVLQPP